MLEKIKHEGIIPFEKKVGSELSHANVEPEIIDVECEEVNNDDDSLLSQKSIIYRVLAEIGGASVVMLLAYGLVITQASMSILPIALISTVSASTYLLLSARYFFQLDK